MHGRKDIRLKNYDYTTNGYYFVTAVTKIKENIFTGKERLIESRLKDTLTKIPGTKLDYSVVMPNHVHLIIILQNCTLHLGEIIRRFKAKVSHILNDNVWQANYYEHVIRNEKALEKIRGYIINNPQELLLKFAQFYK
jgi:REP element-mobilizing transposase RayT